MSAIQRTLGLIEDAERAYQESLSVLTTQVAQEMRLLAENVMRSNSQATFFEALRALYWHSKVSTNLIAEAFGIKEKRVAVIAGPLASNIDCEHCGAALSVLFTSRHHRKHFDSTCQKCEARLSEQRETERREYYRQLDIENAVISTQAHATHGHSWVALEHNPDAEAVTFFCNLANCDARITRLLVKEVPPSSQDRVL